MAAIDIGPGATDRGSVFGAGSTLISKDNPANDTGTLTSFELWFTVGQDGVGVKAGTFHGAATEYTSRDVETIGAVAGGSKQTFSGLDCDVTTGDFAGIYYSGGQIELCTAGCSGSGFHSKAGDQFGAGQQTYAASLDYDISIYGTSAIPAVGRSFGFIIG